MQAYYRAFPLIATLIATNYLLVPPSVLAVSPGRYESLTKEEFLRLDKDVAEIFETSYEQMDNLSPLTYDEQLFRLLRAYRHSILIYYYDYFYSKQDYMEQSQGPKVNKNLCQQQLETLVAISKTNPGKNYGYQANESTPFSVINFFDTYGRSESALLDGNSVWLGSYAGCIKAKIPAKSAQLFRPDQTTEGSDINGRYCVAHLKAKAWPKWDIYFEDRISIKVGLCLPESCHSLHYAQDETIRSNVDHLSRSHLLEPFSSDRYYTDYLYCLPDEDSPFRQLNLGAKLFLAFCLGWAMVLTYANISYGKRMHKLRELQESSERVDDGGDGDGDDCKQVNGTVPTSANSPICKARSRGGFDFIKSFSTVSNLEILCNTNISGINLKPRKPIETSKRQSINHSNGNQKLERDQSISLVLRRLSNAIEDDSQTVEDLNLVAAAAAAPNHQQAIPEEEPFQKKKKWVEVQEEKEEKPNSTRKRVNLDILDGVKVGATILIVWAHTFYYKLNSQLDLKEMGSFIVHDLTMNFFLSSPQIVSIFFITTGTLLTYLAFTRTKPKELLQPSYWVLLIVGRYLRLIVVYFLVFWWIKHVAPHTGSGAYWTDYRTDDEHPRTYCTNESWLTMLTLSAGDVKLPSGCVSQAWYLTVDFRCLFIIPFYIILLTWNKFYAYGAIVLTIIVTFWRNVLLMQGEKLDWTLTLANIKAHSFSMMNDRSHDSYTDLFFRLSTCLMGVTIGHLLYLYETRQIKDWPWWFRAYGIKFATTMIAILTAGPAMMANPTIAQFLSSEAASGAPIEPASSDLVAITIPALKLAMEINFSIVLILLMTGGGFKTLNKFLSSRVVKILSSISYAVFLIHIDLMFRIPQIKFEQLYWIQNIMAVFFIAISYVIAFFIHVLFEMPMSHLTRHLIKILDKFMATRLTWSVKFN